MVDISRNFVSSTCIGPSANVASNCQVLLTVLAAGGSRRLGQPKQLVKLDGEPLVRRQCRIAIESQLGSVMVVLGRDANECTTAISDLPVTRQINNHWSEGLSSSIRQATQAAIDIHVGGLPRHLQEEDALKNLTEGGAQRAELARLRHCREQRNACVKLINYLVSE